MNKYWKPALLAGAAAAAMSGVFGSMPGQYSTTTQSGGGK